MNRREFVKSASLSLLVLPVMSCATAETAPDALKTEMDAQPFAFQIRRLLEALDFVGAPVAAEDKKAIETAIGKADAGATNKSSSKF